MMTITKIAALSPDKFCYWLKGFTELHGALPTEEQWKHIKEHLDMVFDHAAPSMVDLHKVPAIDSGYSPPIRPNIKDMMIC